MKLIAVDLDGTLLSHEGEVHEADRDALLSAKERGHVVTIITGRLWSGTRKAARVIEVERKLACLEGSTIIHGATGEEHAHHPLPRDAGERLATLLHDAGAALFLFASDRIVCDPLGERYLPYVSAWSTSVEVCAKTVDHVEWRSDRGTSALVAVGPAGAVEGSAEKVRRSHPGELMVATFPIARLPGNLHGLIARKKGVDKGTALVHLAEDAGVPVKDTVAIGDWLNDIPMLRVAGRSFAMGQAPTEVRDAATDVVPQTSSEGGGVREALRRLGIL